MTKITYADIKFANSETSGLAPKLHNEINLSLDTCSKDKLPSEIAIRKAIDGVPARNTAHKNLGNGIGIVQTKHGIYDRMEGHILIHDSGNPALSSLENSTYILYNPIVYESNPLIGKAYLNITDIPEAVNPDNPTTTIGEHLKVATKTYDATYREGQRSVGGGRFHYGLIFYEALMNEQNPICTFKKDECVGKIFIKCLSGMMFPDAEYSIGSYDDPEKYVKKFSFSSLSGLTGVLRDWEYGDSILTNEYVYMNNDPISIPDSSDENSDEAQPADSDPNIAYLYSYDNIFVPSQTEQSSATGDDEIAPEDDPNYTSSPLTGGSFGICMLYDKVYRGWNAGYMMPGKTSSGTSQYVQKINLADDRTVRMISKSYTSILSGEVKESAYSPVDESIYNLNSTINANISKFNLTNETFSEQYAKFTSISGALDLFASAANDTDWYIIHLSSDLIDFNFSTGAYQFYNYRVSSLGTELSAEAFCDIYPLSGLSGVSGELSADLPTSTKDICCTMANGIMFIASNSSGDLIGLNPIVGTFAKLASFPSGAPAGSTVIKFNADDVLYYCGGYSGSSPYESIMFFVSTGMFAVPKAVPTISTSYSIGFDMSPFYGYICGGSVYTRSINNFTSEYGSITSDSGSPYRARTIQKFDFSTLTWSVENTYLLKDAYNYYGHAKAT